MANGIRGLLFVWVSLGAAILAQPARGAEEGTINAFAAWQGDGEALQTGTNEVTYIGTMSGAIYVETDKGPAGGGQIVCPAILLVDTEDGTQSALGRCSITTKNGAKIFAQIACAGVHMVGCDGEFVLAGGTGRFSGITGSGPFTVRSSLHELVVQSGGTLTEAVNGIIFWKRLRYHIP